MEVAGRIGEDGGGEIGWEGGFPGGDWLFFWLLVLA